jgi:hypothetical protein
MKSSKDECAHFRSFLLFRAADLKSLHACLNSCVDLASIDLSNNLLTASSLSVLDGRKFSKLKQLNLAGNKIENLTTIPFSSTLQTLHLEGNAISDTSSFAQLRERCPNLHQLFLQRGTQTNPVCSQASYRLDLLAFFPHLKVLDGERLTLGGGGPNTSFHALYSKLDAETAQYADAKSSAARRASQEMAKANEQQVQPKMEDWLPQTTWPTIRPADVDAELAPRLTALRTTLKECATVLAEECDASLKELEKKYGSKDGKSAGGDASASPVPSSGEGDFGTFGED